MHCKLGALSKQEFWRPPKVGLFPYQGNLHNLYWNDYFLKSGQWFCGKLHGEGVLTWNDGRRFKGQFSRNVYQGFGRLEVPSGNDMTIYEGMWKNGKLEGKGVIK